MSYDIRIDFDRFGKIDARWDIHRVSHNIHRANVPSGRFKMSYRDIAKYCVYVGSYRTGKCTSQAFCNFRKLNNCVDIFRHIP